MSRRTLAWLVALSAILIVLVAVVVRLRPKPSLQHLKISTATIGGTYYPLGAQLARILEQLPGRPIQRAVAEQSNGSVENIQRLVNAQADVAFVMGPALFRAIRESPEAESTISVLARLYKDDVLVVVRKETGIRNIAGLKNARLFIGSRTSGTRMAATHILETVGLSENDYTADDAGSFAEAANRLIEGDIDAAFFMVGMPAEAVQRVLEWGGAELLSMAAETRRQLASGPDSIGLAADELPANLFPNQPKSIHTMSADVFLVARNDLPRDIGFIIVKALFDNIADLLLAHPKAQDVKLTEAFDVPEGLPFHAGAAKFRKTEEGSLLIATGAIEGKNYRLGKMMQALLAERGIPARVTHSDGSLENAMLLSKRPSIAIMQYDAALASRFGKPRFVYNLDLDELSVPTVSNIQRLAVLHDAKVQMFIRREKLALLEESLNQGLPPSKRTAITTLGEVATALGKLPPGEPKLRVCLGPVNSATQMVARVVLKHHGVHSDSITPLFLSVPNMVARLHSEEIDVGFFVSYVPCLAIRTILNDDSIKLLSMAPKEQALMSGTVFTMSTIEPGTYACQREDEPAIQTLSIHEVLATTEDLPFDVKAITRAIFEGEAFLNIAGGADALALDLASLPLHPDAKEYYQEAGHLPATFVWHQPFEWIHATWRLLATLVIVVAGCAGVIKLKRNRTATEIGRKILAISPGVTESDSVEKLLVIRDEIQERVRRRWWHLGELDNSHWRYLHGLIDDRVNEAKKILTRALVSEIRRYGKDGAMDGAVRQARHDSLMQRIWAFFESGELEAAQHDLLLKMLQDHAPQDSVEQTPRDEKDES
ncbi:MAG: TAXI family TRAP transporter solute-binding subunit [Acidobacteriota bacterium]|nr:MAG: TAXI family TRAP transporter solute-binding subunit [Acidobacteriota bacterium]